MVGVVLTASLFFFFFFKGEEEAVNSCFVSLLAGKSAHAQRFYLACNVSNKTSERLQTFISLGLRG